MSYVAWSVVFGEQPTASKWNILGTNDASFNDGTGIADDAILARHIANLAVSNAQMAADTWLWEKLVSVTLGSAGDTLSTGTFTARKYLKVLFYVPTSGAISQGLRFNNDSGTNYAFRYIAGGAFGTVTSQTSISGIPGTGVLFGSMEVVNVAGTQKVGKLTTTIGGNTAATTQADADYWFNWVNTSVQITRIDLINSGAGDFAIGSQIIVLGHD